MSWQWLAHPVAQCLTLALVHFLWQGAVLAAIASLLLRRMAQSSPANRYAVCLMLLLVMACCPLATCLVLNATTAMPVVQPAAAAILVEARAEAVIAVPQQATASDSNAGWSHRLLATWQPCVLIGYLGGVVLLSIRFGCGYFGTLWLRSAVEELSPEWTERVTRLAARLGVRTTTRVVVSLRAGEAIAVGWLRPVVLLPLGWLTMLPPDALEAVIAHELAHLRRFDLWIGLVQRAIETLLFYHPAVWWLSRRTTLEREMCCDALAVEATGQRLSYVKALETLGSRVAGDGRLLLATTFLGESDMNLLARVRQVLGLRPQRETGRAWPAGLAALGLAVALLAVAALPDRQTALAQDEHDEQTQRREGDRRSPEADAPRREGGDRPRDGEVRREGDRPRDGEARREGEPRRDGERPRGDNPPPPRRDGDRPPTFDRRPLDGDPPPRRDGERGGPPRPGFPPPMAERDRELIEVIRQLQREVAELRREVAQLRGGPRPDPRYAEPRDGDRPQPAAPVRGPRDGERPPRDGDRGPRPAFGAESPDGGFGFGSAPAPRPRDGDAPRRGPRDGEGDRPGPRDGEARKEGPRDGEAKKDAPRDGEARKAGPRDGEVKKDAPRDGESRKEGPRDGEARKDAPRDGEARRPPAKADPE